jgi:adenylate cyclase
MENAAKSAVACALDMHRGLEKFNTQRQAHGQNPIAIGIGVHTGVAVCGAIGSTKTLQYTAIGDTVNTGSRLCGVALPGQTVISAQTLGKLNNEATVKALPTVSVKGKREPLQLFNVLALGTQSV